MNNFISEQRDERILFYRQFKFNDELKVSNGRDKLIQRRGGNLFYYFYFDWLSILIFYLDTIFNVFY